MKYHHYNNIKRQQSTRLNYDKHDHGVNFTRMGCSRAVVVRAVVSRRRPASARLLSEMPALQPTLMTAADQSEHDDSAPLPLHEQQTGLQQPTACRLS